jgi:tetratricopeptide (TPR) repeat protein
MEGALEKIEKARALLEANKISEAEGQLRQAIALDKRSVIARVELARILGAGGRNAESIKLIDEALGLDPGNAEALALKGLSLALQGEYNKAISYYRRSIERNSNLGMAYTNLGAALREIGNLEESEKVLRRGSEIEPKSFHMHYELAQTLAHQIRIKEAIFEVLETLKLNPFFVRGYLALARLYQQGNEPDDAIKILQQCLKVNPEAWEAIELLKDFYMLKGNFKAARKTWEQVVGKRGGSNDFVQLGNIALAAGEFEQAEKSFKRAAELAPEAWQPHYALAELYDVANREEIAGPEYELAVKYNKDAFQPHNGLGLYLLKKGQIERAIDQLTIAYRQAPEDEPAPLYNLALALAQGGKLTQAKDILQSALLQAPEGGLYDEMRRLLNAIRKQEES